MSSLVGIIRTETEIKKALAELETLDGRAQTVSAQGGSAYNPGWHLALQRSRRHALGHQHDVAHVERQESRGGHTRDDYPGMRPDWRKINLVCALEGDEITITRQPTPKMRDDLIALFDRSELKKYLSEDEMAAMPPEAGVAASAASEESH
jgi:succinate dehydrogenase / fumarate reductase flavoprotein subunit